MKGLNERAGSSELLPGISGNASTWALVGSPLQLLCLEEACESFDLHRDDALVLVAPPESRQAHCQMQKCLTRGRWENVLILPNLTSAEGIRESRILVANLVARYGSPSVFVLGDFRMLLGAHIARRYRPRTILVDDGSAMLRFSADRFGLHRYSGARRRKAPDWIRRLSHRFRYGIDSGPLPPMTIFTIYDKLSFGPADIVEGNRFEKLRNDCRISISPGEVWVVGGCLVELGLVSPEFYERQMEGIARQCKGRAVKYFPHRREDAARYSGYERLYGFKITETDLPLELFLIDSLKAPEVIYGFYSTALDTLYRLTEGLSTEFVAMRIPSEKILSASDAPFIRSVYENFESYTSRFAIIDSF